jgi:hypothetical protein
MGGGGKAPAKFPKLPNEEQADFENRFSEI